ncbi:MAG: efflux RND transporter periplasmic adaptor subunit [Muribaculaceae bacterium]|jgi:HlyD family secretion protein|nr:efflux RND transporter periplasmic adaptor subunit [Muribaculaceae bacterium]
MKKVFKIAALILIPIIIIGTFVFLFVNSHPGEKKYNTVTPALRTIEHVTVVTGKIEPRNQIDIKPKISGIISEVSKQAGDYVHKGEVIAKINVVPDASQLSSAENRLNVAQYSYEKSQRDYKREKMLHDKDLVSQEEYDNSLTEYNKAKEELANAHDAVTIAREGMSKYNAAQSNTLVRSTIDGVVLDVPIKVGSSVIMSNSFNDGTTIATVADMNDLIFKGKIDETEVGMLQVGMAMNITVGALPDLKIPATLEYISPKGTDDNGSNTFEIKAALKISGKENIRAGYSANASIVLEKVCNVLSLPESSIDFSGDTTFVYLLTDSIPQQKFRKTKVTTGVSDGIYIQMKDGVRRNDRVKILEK